MTHSKITSRTGQALLIAILASCTHDAVPASTPDPAEAEISDALVATANANAKVAEIEKRLANLDGSQIRAKTRQTETEPVATGTEPAGPVRIDWNGPVEPLLHSIARLARYSVVVTGNPPVNPLQVSVTGFEGQPLDAVRKIDGSVFGAARITAKAESRTITLVYAS